MLNADTSFSYKKDLIANSLPNWPKCKKINNKNLSVISRQY